MGGRIDHDVLQLAVDPAGQLVDLADAVDLVAEPLDAKDILAPLGGKDLQGVAPDPEIAAVEGHVIARILNGHQLLQDLVPVLLHARAEGDGHALEFVGTAQAVDAGDRGHDDHVPALGQRGCRRQTELVNLVVDHGVLGDIGVTLGNIGLRLIIVVIGNKIFHRVLGEKLLHLAVELAGQGLVVGDDQRGLVEGLDDIGHGEGLARARHAQQGLKLIALLKALYQLLDRLRLIAGRLIF